MLTFFHFKGSITAGYTAELWLQMHIRLKPKYLLSLALNKCMNPIFERLNKVKQMFVVGCRMMWAAGAVAAMSSITFPAISAIVSRNADPDQQGKWHLSISWNKQKSVFDVQYKHGKETTFWILGQFRNSGEDNESWNLTDTIPFISIYLYRCCPGDDYWNSGPL